MRLETIQKDFIDALFGGDKDAAAAHVIGDQILSAKERFGIYRGSVHGILKQALGLTFPVCKQIVGDTFFDRMCGLFIDQYPPKTSFFAHYGDEFYHFLMQFEPVNDLPYLPDVARLEWGRHAVWHEKAHEHVDFSGLAELTETEQAHVVFKLAKTLHLLQSNFRIDDIWFAHQQESDLKLEEINLNEAVKLFIWKDKDMIKISLMSLNEEDSIFWDFLNAIQKGSTLETLAEQFDADLPRLLNQGIESGWIQSFKIKKLLT